MNAQESMLSIRITSYSRSKICGGVFNSTTNEWVMDPVYRKLDPDKSRSRELIGFWATESRKMNRIFIKRRNQKQSGRHMI